MYALVKLFTTNGVSRIKALDIWKWLITRFCYTLVKLRLNNRPIEFTESIILHPSSSQNNNSVLASLILSAFSTSLALLFLEISFKCFHLHKLIISYSMDHSQHERIPPIRIKLAIVHHHHHHNLCLLIKTISNLALSSSKPLKFRVTSIWLILYEKN